MIRRLSIAFRGLAFLAATVPAHAQRYIDQDTYDQFVETITHAESFFTVSTIWVLMASALVFVMHMGFASLEAGLTRPRNCVNILFKNLFVINSALLLYAFVGYRTMYPGAEFNGFWRPGFGFGIETADYLDLMTPLYGEVTWWAHLLFQAMFAATAATIVSGAVAERIRLGSFMIFVVLLVGLAYPISGSWVWESAGWLARQGFHDFAGATVVHTFGGFAALACVLLLGPRSGKYSRNGIKPIPGHNLPLATLGLFFLWLGWFGFNGGSVMSAHPEMVSMVIFNTALSGAAGGLAAMLLTQLLLGKADITMAINGVLAGLVAITGVADSVFPGSSWIIGGIGGFIVVGAILAFDRVGIDDPVGAISVHGIGGLWGTLAVGLWGKGTVIWQLAGALAVALFAFAFSFAVFALLKLTLGVRVSREDEERGLDLAEHGQEAYVGDA